MTMNRSGKETLQAFFKALGEGDIATVLEIFSEDAILIAVSESGIEGSRVYGRYEGRVGVESFLKNLSDTFDTQSFVVNQLAGQEALAFAQGHFVHRVRATDKLFSSDWALLCEVENGLITVYRFFEDSASFVQANQVQ